MRIDPRCKCAINIYTYIPICFLSLQGFIDQAENQKGEKAITVRMKRKDTWFLDEQNNNAQLVNYFNFGANSKRCFEISGTSKKCLLQYLINVISQCFGNSTDLEYMVIVTQLSLSQNSSKWPATAIQYLCKHFQSCVALSLLKDNQLITYFFLRGYISCSWSQRSIKEDISC